MIKTLSFWYFFYLLISSGNATAFSRSDIGVVVLFCVTAIVMLLKRIPITNTLLKILAVWFFYFVASTIAIGSFHPLFMIMVPSYILAAYTLVSLSGDRAVFYYEKSMYCLSWISLLFFGWELLSLDSLYAVLKPIDLSGGLFPNSAYYSNVLVYTVSQWSVSDIALRNAGFCWEPGPFSCFIVLAMFFNMNRTNFQLKGNRIFWVLFVTLLTTQSTTGLVAFMALSFWYVINNRSYRKIMPLAIPVLIAGAFWTFAEIPYLQEKIQEEYRQKEQLDELVERTQLEGDVAAPGRFLSFSVAWKDFLERPFLGYGGNADLQWTRQAGAGIAVISGFGNLIARYGLFGLFCWMLLLIKSGRFYSQIRNRYRLWSIWPFLNVIIAWAFGIILSPIFFFFYFIPYFQRRKAACKYNI